jgi:hypothetical protein
MENSNSPKRNIVIKKKKGNDLNVKNTTGKKINKKQLEKKCGRNC